MELMAFIEHNWFPITLIASIITFTIKLNNVVNNYMQVLNDLKEDISDFKVETDTKFKNIDKRFDQHRDDREEDKERTRLIMQGVEATLISLKNDGHNGPVTKSLDDINEYKTKKAAE